MGSVHRVTHVDTKKNCKKVSPGLDMGMAKGHNYTISTEFPRQKGITAKIGCDTLKRDVFSAASQSEASFLPS